MNKKLLVSLAAVGMLMLAGCQTASASYENEAAYETGDFTYHAAEIANIEVNWPAGSVAILQGTADTLTVSENGTSLSADAQMHHLIEGDTLKIEYCASDAGKIDGKEKQLSLEVPEGVNLTVDVVNAPVSMADVTLGNCAVATESGNVTTGMITADSFSIETVAGSVTTDGINADTMSCKSLSGALHLGLTKGESFHVETSSGPVVLVFDDTFGAKISFTSKSGDIKTERDYTSQNRQWVYGDGTCALSIETGSANVAIQ